MNKQLSKIGIFITAIYMIALFILVQDRLGNISSLTLNELGDFFAGAFGPLAILWLILGFFQQGVELRQNTSALELQAEELKNSVRQQKELVEVTRQQFKAELEALSYEREQQRKLQEPVFVTHGIGASHSGHKHTYNLTISNVGNTATNVHITFNREMKRLTPIDIPSFTKDTNSRITFEYLEWVPEKDTIMTINYTSSSGVPGAIEYNLVPDFTNTHPSVHIEKVQS